jgi:all-beta uncharacterized protein/uncharacterized protein DUF4114
MIGWNNSQRLRMFVVLGLSVSLLCMKSPMPSNGRALAQASSCEGGVGGRILSAGGDVVVEILPCVAGFTSELSLVSPGATRYIGTNRDIGTIVTVGSFPAGVELVFSIYVRETQRTFYSGSASSNPDGVGHGEVTCLSKGKSRIGFEDQFGGGDRNYADLICEVRQPLNGCTYSMSPSSQSFDSSGGSGTVQIVSGSGCNWSASANANWISINSGGSGSASGAISYSVASNPGSDSRSGTISVQGDAFTVYQDGVGAGPVITSASRSGKQVLVYGVNFDSGSVILLNGEKQKTLHDDSNPRTVLIGKKLGRWAVAGDRLQVRTSTGALSAEYTYAP